MQVKKKKLQPYLQTEKYQLQPHLQLENSRITPLKIQKIPVATLPTTEKYLNYNPHLQLKNILKPTKPHKKNLK